MGKQFARQPRRWRIAPIERIRQTPARGQCISAPYFAIALDSHGPNSPSTSGVYPHTMERSGKAASVRPVLRSNRSLPLVSRLMLADRCRTETGLGRLGAEKRIQAIVQGYLLTDGKLAPFVARGSGSARDAPAVGTVLAHLAVTARVFPGIVLGRNVGLHHGTRLC